MPVSTLLKNVTSRELTEWKAYYRLKKERMEKNSKKSNAEINKNLTF